MITKIQNGMDMESVRRVFLDDASGWKITADIESGNLRWMTFCSNHLYFGIYPSVQVAAKAGKVVEVSIMPNWEAYGREGDMESAKKIYLAFTMEAERLYGGPYKETKCKKNWMLPDGRKLKVEFEKREWYTVKAVIKKDS